MGRLVGGSVASAAEFYASTILASARSLWSSSSSSRKRLQIAAGNRYLYSLLPDIPRSGNMGSCSGGSRSFACYISVLEPRISQYRFVCCVVVVVVVVVVSLLILCALCLRVSVFLLVIFVSLCVLKIWRSMRFFVFPPRSCTPASIERNNILEPPRSRCLSSAFGDFFFVTDDVQIVRQVRKCAISRMSWTFHHRELLPSIPATSCDSSLGMIIWAFLSIRLSAVLQLRYRRRRFTWCQPIFFSLKLNLHLK
jgi:hypothetical protein